MSYNTGSDEYDQAKQEKMGGDSAGNTDPQLSAKEEYYQQQQQMYGQSQPQSYAAATGSSDNIQNTPITIV